MRSPLLIIHLIGLAAFLGSVFGHIVLGRLADPAADAAAYALLQDAKHATTMLITGPGLVITGITGLVLLLTRRSLFASTWLKIKLALVAAIGGNAMLVLIPLGVEIAEKAAAGAPPDALTALAGRESLFGAANLLMVLTVITLSVVRPWQATRSNTEGSPTRAL